MLAERSTVGALLAHLGQAMPEQEAVVWPPQRLTYAALCAQATGVAGGLWENVYRRQGLEIGRGSIAIKLGEYMIAVAPDGDGKRVSVIGLFGETRIRKSLPIAEKPLDGDLVLQSCGDNSG
jgi:hypothetical protein